MFQGFLSKKRGFTITEMMIIVIILGILAAVALPQYKYAVERLKVSEAISILTNVLGAQKRYKFENGDYALSLQDLDVTVPPSKNFVGLTFFPNNGAAVALIKRNGTGEYSYSMSIHEDGTFSCAGGADDICAKIKTWQ